MAGSWDGQQGLLDAVTSAWAQELIGDRPASSFLDLRRITLETPEQGVPFNIKSAVDQSMAAEIMVSLLNLTAQGKTGTPSPRDLKGLTAPMEVMAPDSRD
eukprot:3938096-Rhodomonas_salina.1